MKKESHSLVSVILCNYNYGQYIGEAINSVLSQTHENVELVIVDDGSTDNSRDIIAAYTDVRIKKIFQGNSGQAAAFNAGYERCSGEFIAFLDSDDYWCNNKLFEVLKQFKDEDVCMVQHHLNVVDKEGRDVGRLQHRIKPGLSNVLNRFFKKNHTGFFVATSGIVCRKKALDEIFPLGMDWKICADVAFTRPLPLFGKIYTMPETLGCYRVHGENNWVNTEQQGKWLVNQKKYVNYTNHWLKQYGFQRQIVFEKSLVYKEFVLKNKIPGLRTALNFLFDK